MKIIQESDGINPRPTIEFDEYERNEYVRRFLEVFNADLDEQAMCSGVYAIHCEIANKHDLYIAVFDRLEARQRRALHEYAQCLGVWAHRRIVPKLEE